MGYSPRCSRTIRTARSRTSGEKRFDFLLMAPSSQSVEPPQNPGRFSLEFVAGIGQHPSNQWPGEPSYLVFGLTLEAAKTLGTRLEQNAIVWNGSDGTPQLILLR